MISSTSIHSIVVAMVVLCAAVLCGQLGCDRGPNVSTSDSPTTAASPSPNDAPLDNSQIQQPGLDGQSILEKVVARYANAQSYRDKAILYLNYQLEGRRIQEPHPFSTILQQNQKLSSRIFNGQIQCDGQRLSCYVFDIETANLDNQQLWIPTDGRIPVTQLYGDAIVRHFLGGYSELPLDESRKDLPPKLVPPPLSLLTGELPFGWIQTAEQVQRLPDATINETDCFVVRSLFNDSTADIWIDQATWLLVKISMPLKLMDRKVLTSGEIAGVELLFQFHEAELDPVITDQTFAVSIRPEATAVTQFVPIPDPFPSDLIGELAPDFKLFSQDQTALNRLTFDGKTTALLWLGGKASYGTLAKFSQLNRKYDEDNFHFAAVYSDLDLSESNSSSPGPNRELKATVLAENLNYYYDRNLDASSQLRIKALPTIIILDVNSKIQFARALDDDDWANDVNAALRRIAEGDDVASEMKQEYQRFLDQYHLQLTQHSATATGVIGSLDSQSASTADSNPQIISSGFRKSLLEPEPAWSNSNFQKPGNMLFRAENDSLLVFDGWRTIVELNRAGKTKNRHQLLLPASEAASCIRFTSPNATNPRSAVFDVNGRQVYLFNENWLQLGTIPDASFRHDGIRDVLFCDVSGDGIDELVIAFGGAQGVWAFDLQKNTAKQISIFDAQSLSVIAGKLLGCDRQSVSLLGPGLKPVPTGQNVVLQRIEAAQSQSQTAITALAADANQDWFAIGFHPTLNVAWQQSVGPQEFTTQVEPIRICRMSNGDLVSAIADSNGGLIFLSQSGSVLGQLAADGPINGFTWVTDQSETLLVVSRSSRVDAYRIKSSQSSFQPASTSR